MTTPAERWADANRIFHAALDLTPDVRDAFLDQACGGDASLCAEVASLLRFHEQAQTFLDTPAVDVTDVTLEGQQIGPYRILREAGHGGMGVVYLAEDTRLGRTVAFKALPAAWTGDAVRRERLRHEARAAATLSHPGVATIYALEEIDGQLYLVSEFVRGETLRDELQHGPLSLRQVIDTGLGLAEALAAAHDRDVVHRDLKPENVLRTTEGRVKIVDFGLAGLGPATEPAPLMGTPAYMSPEQLRGEPAGTRADVYALGVMLHELATGLHPLAAGDVRVPLPQMAHSLGPLAEPLDAVIARAMAADPAGRYESAHALVAALTAIRPDVSAEPRREAQPLPLTTPPLFTPLWWWQFHQVATSVAYGVVLYFLWYARSWATGAALRAVFFVALAAALAANTLRLHLWATSRFFPDEWLEQRRQAWTWIRLSDAAFGIALLVTGAANVNDHPGFAALFVGCAVANLFLFTIIEPSTTRAAAKQIGR